MNVSCTKDAFSHVSQSLSFTLPLNPSLSFSVRAFLCFHSKIDRKTMICSELRHWTIIQMGRICLWVIYILSGCMFVYFAHTQKRMRFSEKGKHRSSWMKVSLSRRRWLFKERTHSICVNLFFFNWIKCTKSIWIRFGIRPYMECDQQNVELLFSRFISFSFGDSID